MRKYSKYGVAVVGAVAALLLTGCGQEKPVEYKMESEPSTQWHKAEAKNVEGLEGMATGWVQMEDSIAVSLSGPDNCLPKIDKVSKKGKVVSIYLKDSADDCSTNIQAEYTTIEDVKKVERVEVFEAGYSTSFELQEAPALAPQ